MTGPFGSRAHVTLRPRGVVGGSRGRMVEPGVPGVTAAAEEEGTGGMTSMRDISKLVS